MRRVREGERGGEEGHSIGLHASVLVYLPLPVWAYYTLACKSKRVWYWVWGGGVCYSLVAASFISMSNHATHSLWIFEKMEFSHRLNIDNWNQNF